MSRADKQDVARTAGRLQGVDSAARAALIKDGATPQILVRFTTQGRKGKERELTPAQAGARAVSRKASRRPVKAQIVKEWRTADGTKRRAVTSARKLKTAADWAALRQDVATHMGARIADLSRPYRGGKGFDPSFDVARGIRQLAFVQMAKGAGIFAMVLATPALVGGLLTSLTNILGIAPGSLMSETAAGAPAFVGMGLGLMGGGIHAGFERMEKGLEAKVAR